MNIKNKIQYAREKLGVTNCFQCSGEPTNEEEYNSMVTWEVGVDDDRNVIYDNMQQVTWNQVNQYAAEALQDRKMTVLRFERDRRIASTDWWVLPDRTPTTEQLAYRQALRDITLTANPELNEFDDLILDSVNWPEMPK